MLLLGGEAAAAVFDFRHAREDADNRDVVVDDDDVDWRSFGRTGVVDDVPDDFPLNDLLMESTTTTAFGERPPPPPPPPGAAGHSDSDLSGTLEQLALLAPLIKECERESTKAAPADAVDVSFANATSTSTSTKTPPETESNVASPAFGDFSLSALPPPPPPPQPPSLSSEGGRT